MKTKNLMGFVLGGLAIASSVLYIACDSSDSAVKEPTPVPDSGLLADGARPDAGPLPDGALPDGAPGDCFLNPKTHFEIINACTDAVKITKNPTLPLLLTDGGLPPLP
jgi:hypothetical protein